MSVGALRGAPTCHLRLYGDWFVGFSEMPSSDALERTASSLRPSLRPITRVGVFSRARCLISLTSLEVQDFPELRVYFGIDVSLCLPCRAGKTSRRRRRHRTESLNYRCKEESEFCFLTSVRLDWFTEPTPGVCSALVFGEQRISRRTSKITFRIDRNARKKGTKRFCPRYPKVSTILLFFAYAWSPS